MTTELNDSTYRMAEASIGSTEMLVMNPLDASGLQSAAITSRIARDVMEPLLMPEANRFVMFPIKYGDLYDMYKQHVSIFWRPEELDLSQDREHFLHKLSDNDRHFIKRILGFFAGSDGIVMENLSQRFMAEVQVLEAKAFYSFQHQMEVCHSITYSMLIDTYIGDKEEKDFILNSIQTIPCVAQKADWALKWIRSNTADFATRLMAFAVVEGVFFSGAFCSIYWIKNRGLMPGLTASNELIARDEGLHTDFACMMFKKCVNRPSTENAIALMQEAVAIEKQFILDALPCSLIGMSAPRMSEYIEFVADRLMMALGYPRIWGTGNPFPWMEKQALQGKVNFFEKLSTGYQLANSLTDPEENRFATNLDF